MAESELAEDDEAPRPWWSPARWWNRVTKVMLGACALASAVAAVLSLFAPHPTANSARFTSVQLIDSEPLNEYQQRLSAFTSPGGDDLSATPSGTAGSVAVPSGSAGPAPSSPVSPPSATETTASAATGPTASGVSPTATSTTDTPASRPPGAISISPPISKPSYVRYVDNETGEECLPAPYCRQFIDGASADGPGKLVSPQAAAQRVTDILRETQTTTRTAGHKPEPLGEVISVNLELTGLRGRAVYLGWSIYPANGGTSLYGNWLNRFIAYQLEATTDDDTGSTELWVPLPKTAGSYFVRMTLFTKEADLASDDSGSFR